MYVCFSLWHVAYIYETVKMLLIILNKKEEGMEVKSGVQNESFQIRITCISIVISVYG